MNKIYRSNHFPLKIALLILFFLFILFSAYIFIGNSSIKSNKIIQLIWCVLFIYSILFVGLPELNSALFNKIIVDGNTITIIDYMPKLLINLPVKQVIFIDKIESIFFATYDLNSSIKTSRFKFNKNSKAYNYILSKNQNIIKYLVLKIKMNTNAYIRYYWCLSNISKKEIINHIQSINKSIVNRM